jgi:hypothetical protein
MQITDEEMDYALNRSTKGIAKERGRLAWALDRLAHEKKLNMNFQAQIDKLEEDEKGNNANLQALQEVRLLTDVRTIQS